MSFLPSKSANFPSNIPILLDGRPVEKITAFLYPKGGNDDPKKLLANSGKSFQGIVVLGMGFTFDDTSEEATPIIEMERLIAENPHYQNVIYPYIGGSEVNSSPTHKHHRYIINWGAITEQEARVKYPDLMTIVEEKVKPHRMKQASIVNPARWWMFARSGEDLRNAIAQCDRVLFHAYVGKYMMFAFLPSNWVFAGPHYVFALQTNSSFCVLQCLIHEVWARFFSASFKDDLRYTPSDCFETFPFPENWETDPTLESIGKTYYEYRADLMVRNNQGLTDTYNRFHDPAECDPDILKLRDLHTQMDCAVLTAYGWSDIDTTCGFALDYLDTDEDNLPPEVQERIDSGDLFFPTADEACAFDSIARTGKRKLPWRYKWPEATHDEVLARLLDLNQKRHEEEILRGKHAQKKENAKATQKRKGKKAQVDSPQLPLFPSQELP